MLPSKLADILQRLDPAGAKDKNENSYLATHPLTVDRIARLTKHSFGNP